MRATAFQDETIVLISLVRNIVLSALRIYYISTAQTSDPSWTDFNIVLVTEIDMNLSVIVACIPFTKPFVDSLQGGMFNADPRILTPRRSSYNRRKRYGLGLFSRSGGTRSNAKSFFHTWNREWPGDTSSDMHEAVMVGGNMHRDLESSVGSFDAERTITQSFKFSRLW